MLFQQRQVKLIEVARKTEITLAEHIKRIAPAGGKARMANLTEAQRRTLARKAGVVGGTARAKALTAKRRSEIAKAAAAARWKSKSATNKNP